MKVLSRGQKRIRTSFLDGIGITKGHSGSQEDGWSILVAVSFEPLVGGEGDVAWVSELEAPSVEIVERASPTAEQALSRPPRLALLIVLRQISLHLLHLLDEDLDHRLELRRKLAVELGEVGESEGAEVLEFLDVGVEEGDEIEATRGEGGDEVKRRVVANSEGIKVLEDLEEGEDGNLRRERTSMGGRGASKSLNIASSAEP